ncbi:hypothetical protein [Tetrasphaera phage TJE1]|uniref:Uncharacterized protein n=1 Tax=Tetrasphaera phage TJE1 TaxID=981335 RepID=G4W969_9CAUD|nr:hypothetical protein G185_gp37 [Tetrasphaera phage TJE1]ADX42557.1 hypothetical protein [Tetrasphaera phage TJE1]
MADLATAVLSGASVALNLVRQFLSNPSITYVPVVNGVPGPPQTVVMQVEVFDELLANQASKMLLIDVSKGKSFLNDNIAPLPRVWEIKGYLFPLIPVTPLVDQISLELLKQTIRDASDSRQVVQFKPVSTAITSQFFQAFQSLASQSVTGTIPAVMTSVKFSYDPTILNKTPFQMTLQKIDTLSAVLDAGNNLIASPNGSITNPAASAASNTLGNTANSSVDVGALQ